MAGLLDNNGSAGLLGGFQRGLAQIAHKDPDEMDIKQRRQQILRSAGPNASLSDIGNKLLQIGDIEGFSHISRMAEANAQRDWTRTYQGGMLDIQRQQLNQPPAAVQTLKSAGVDPTSPEGKKLLFPRTDTPISATDKKAIFSAEDDVPKLEATIANVQAAKQLNPKVYSGIGASMRGAAGAKLPDWMVPDFVASPEGGAATSEWDQLMGAEAIKMMSETLKGASTDFEMRKFLNIAADTSQPPKVRENAMNRFTDLAQKELALRRRRAEGLREGTYFKPGGGEGAPQPAVPQTGAGDKPPVPGARKGKKPDGSEGWFITAPNGKHYIIGE